jgi:hypothetical protein
MNKILSLLFILMITSMTSCGLPLLGDNKNKKGTRDFSTSDPTFSSYIQQFEQEGKTRTGDTNFIVGDIPIQFGDTENENYRGVCQTFTDGTQQIVIKKSWWDAQSEAYRESLIFHELGHCRLGRDHDNAVVEVSSNQYKTSMMNEYIVTPAHYNAHKSAYLDELFTSSTVSVLTAFNK